MYALMLTDSYCPAQTDAAFLDTTLGGVLRAAAARPPDAPALREDDADGALGQQWTYAQLLGDSERSAHAHRCGNIAAPKTPTHWIEVYERSTLRRTICFTAQVEIEQGESTCSVSSAGSPPLH